MASASINILHVDDEPDLAELTADMLEREDDRFSVETAPSVREGWERLAETDVDCVVSDYQMPGQNGIEFLERLREEYPDLPFILYTGKGSEEVASDALSAGATDYLKKRAGTDQYELLANRIQNAVEQSRAQQRAVELGRIRTLVSDINQALVRADSRSEAETRVCELITDSEQYLFAWVGEVAEETDRVEARAWAGLEDDYLDDITVTADETATGRGPVGTAIAERRIAVAQNVQEDPLFDPWREAALERGYQAVAGVPLMHKDTLYGALAVYADRPNPFDEGERELLAELGSDLGHAIHSLEMQREREAIRHRFLALTKNSNLGVITIDEESTIRYANEALEEILGYDPDDLIGESLVAIIPERYRDDHQQGVADYLPEGTKQVDWSWVELPGLHSEGHEVSLGISLGEATVNGNLRITGILRDITERKERQRNLERFKKAVEHAGYAVYITDREGTIEYVNPVFETITGYSAEEALGRNPRILKSGEMSDGYYEELWGTLLDGTVWEEEVINRRQDGELYHARQTIAPIPDENDAIESLVAVQHDVTERKEREKTLERRTQAIEAAPVGISISDPDKPDNPLIYVNDAFTEITGYSYEEILGENCRVLQGEHTDPDTVARIREAIEANEPVSVDLRNYRKDGTEFWNHLEIAPVTNDAGDVINYVGYQRDITERKQRELDLAHQNERLDQFASVVSHDLRNPLTIAQSRLELARDECDSTHLEALTQAHERMNTLIDDLLTLAQTGNQLNETDAVELAPLIEGCWQGIETGDSTIVSETDRTVRADRSRLKQLFENLFRNAVEHGGSEVSITVGDLADNGFFVSDDGPGIPEQEREEIFEVGYSTTEEGLGIGLKIVKEIVHAHGWDITISDSASGGARFEISGVETVGE